MPRNSEMTTYNNYHSAEITWIVKDCRKVGGGQEQSKVKLAA